MGKMHSFFDRGNPCAASFWVVLQSDVITSALYWLDHWVVVVSYRVITL